MEQVQNMYGGEEKTWQLDRFVSFVSRLRDHYSMYVSSVTWTTMIPSKGYRGFANTEVEAAGIGEAMAMFREDVSGG